MINFQANNLFQLQTERIDMKVDMAVNKAMERVLEGISDLKDRMTNFENRVDTRLVAVETKLGIVNETEKEIRAKFFEKEMQVRNKFLDYGFKTGWLLFGSVLTYVLVHIHSFVK